MRPSTIKGIAIVILVVLFIILVGLTRVRRLNWCELTDRWPMKEDFKSNKIFVSSDLKALANFSAYFIYKDPPSKYPNKIYLPVELEKITLNNILDQKLLTLSTNCSKIAMTIKNEDNLRRIDAIQVNLAIASYNEKVCHIQQLDGFITEHNRHYSCHRSITYDCKLKNSAGIFGNTIAILVIDSFEYEIDNIITKNAQNKHYSSEAKECL